MYKRQIQIIILKYSFLKGFVHSNYMTFNQAVCLLPPFFLLVFLCFSSDCPDSTRSHCSFEVSVSCDYFWHYLEQHIPSCLQTHWQPTEIASVLAIQITQAVWFALRALISDLDKALFIFMYVYVLNIYSVATLTTRVINGYKTFFFSFKTTIWYIFWRN